MVEALAAKIDQEVSKLDLETWALEEFVDQAAEAKQPATSKGRRDKLVAAMHRRLEMSNAHQVLKYYWKSREHWASKDKSDLVVHQAWDASRIANRNTMQGAFTTDDNVLTWAPPTALGDQSRKHIKCASTPTPRRQSVCLFA